MKSQCMKSRAVPGTSCVGEELRQFEYPQSAGTDRQTDRQAGRQADRQADRQTECRHSLVHDGVHGLEVVDVQVG